MQFYQFAINRYTQACCQLKCIGIFFILMSVYLLPVILFVKNTWIYDGALFLAGWFAWTFTEYILHRFWMHDKNADHAKPIADSHHHHHTHPTDIRVTAPQRIALVSVSAGLILLSMYVYLYLILLAGFFLGFAGYTCIHWILHQKWSARLFPRLHRFHIYHHCKYPDTCFGISVSWWDLLFKTTPPTETILTRRVIDFYFNGNQKKDFTQRR